LIDDASCLSGKALDAVGIEDADVGRGADGVLDDMVEPGGGRKADLRLRCQTRSSSVVAVSKRSRSVGRGLISSSFCKGI